MRSRLLRNLCGNTGVELILPRFQQGVQNRALFRNVMSVSRSSNPSSFRIYLESTFCVSSIRKDLRRWNTLYWLHWSTSFLKFLNVTHEELIFCSGRIPRKSALARRHSLRHGLRHLSLSSHYQAVCLIAIALLRSASVRASLLRPWPHRAILLWDQHLSSS